MPVSLLGVLRGILKSPRYRRLPTSVDVNDVEDSYKEASNFLRKSRGNRELGLTKDPDKSKIWIRRRK